MAGMEELLLVSVSHLHVVHIGTGRTYNRALYVQYRLESNLRAFAR
jgi:hypothetical protein